MLNKKDLLTATKLQSDQTKIRNLRADLDGVWKRIGEQESEGARREAEKMDRDGRLKDMTELHNYLILQGKSVGIDFTDLAGIEDEF